MTDEPHDHTGEVAHEGTGGTEPPQVPAPQPDLPSVDIPKLEAPVLPPPPTFTPAPHADESVVVATQAPPKQRSAGVLVASLVAVVALIAAVVLGVLWSGASGDADDAKAEAAGVQTELDATKAQLADLQSQVDGLQTDLDDAKESLSAAQSDLDDAKAQNDDLQQQLEDAQANVGPGAPSEITDEFALEFGKAISEQADPPLNDEEATCFGRAFYLAVPFDVLLTVGVSSDPTAQQINTVLDGLLSAADTCNLELDRLGV